MAWIEGNPFIVAFAFLTAVAAVRSQCTYWLGRGIRAGLVRYSWAQSLSQRASAQAWHRIQRWGWPVIPLSFLTVGFQTAVNLSVGLLGWPWRRYTPAAMIGWVLWGFVYAAGGLAVFAGLAALVRRSPLIAGAVVALALTGAVVALRLLKRSRAAAVEPAEAPAD
ncbi:MAG: hypothetical protein LBJ44_10695 [Propionibacteriaceae bacterium]|jgi:membrane protein DedA with SNARE-associated domain|nr:hypothetical protein [Propionibacteriaceae bacterium]